MLPDPLHTGPLNVDASRWKHPPVSFTVTQLCLFPPDSPRLMAISIADDYQVPFSQLVCHPLSCSGEVRSLPRVPDTHQLQSRLPNPPFFFCDRKAPRRTESCDRMGMIHRAAALAASWPAVRHELRRKSLSSMLGAVN